MTPCRLCGSNTEEVVSFGKMPLANAFLRPENISREYFFDLAAVFCPSCFAFQLKTQPDREHMFHADYPFFTGSSQKMRSHFARLAENLIRNHLTQKDSFLVEIGSNDGTFLQNLAQKNIRHLGVEPSEKLALRSRQQGVSTLNTFFEKGTAEKILREHGRADVITAANVMCHIPYLQSVLEGVKILLKPKGIFVFEDPYLGDMLSKVSYDQIYDEHVFIFSLLALRKLFETHGMEIIACEPLPTHGGSMRITSALKGAFPISSSVEKQAAYELSCRLDRIETFRNFRSACERSRKDLLEILSNLKKENKRVMGYAATSKSTTVLNYCGITGELVESICDTTPEKQGCLSPGAHIPVVPHEAFEKNPPDYALLFGWNHQEEIFSKEKPFQNAGGKWLLYVPKIHIVESSACAEKIC